MNEHSNLCKTCYWYDALSDQCYEGHIQYEKRVKCESNKTCKFLNADQAFIVSELEQYRSL